MIWGIVSIILYLIQFISISSAGFIPLEDKFEKLDNTVRDIDRLSREDAKKEILQEKLDSIIKESGFYKNLNKIYSENSDWIDPLSNLFVGITPTLSFSFLLSLILFFYVLIYMHNLSYLAYSWVPTKYSKLARRGFFLILIFFSCALSLPALTSYAILGIKSYIKDSFWNVFYFIAVFSLLSILDILLRKIRRNSISNRTEKAIDESKSSVKKVEKKQKKQKKKQKDNENSKENLSSEEFQLTENQRYARDFLEEFGKSINKE